MVVSALQYVLRLRKDFNILEVERISQMYTLTDCFYSNDNYEDYLSECKTKRSLKFISDSSLKQIYDIMVKDKENKIFTVANRYQDLVMDSYQNQQEIMEATHFLEKESAALLEKVQNLKNKGD